MDADVAARLGLTIARLSRRLRTAGGGLSHGLLSALATIAKKGPLRLADVAQLELVSAPNITRLVAQLEALGLVRRTTDPADGRAFLIEATAAGVDTIRQARSERITLLGELLEHLDPADERAITAALPALELLAQDTRSAKYSALAALTPAQGYSSAGRWVTRRG